MEFLFKIGIHSLEATSRIWGGAHWTTAVSKYGCRDFKKVTSRYGTNFKGKTNLSTLSATVVDKEKESIQVNLVCRSPGDFPSVSTQCFDGVITRCHGCFMLKLGAKHSQWSGILLVRPGKRNRDCPHMAQKCDLLESERCPLHRYFGT
ncbi:hypothetical protein NPIL_619461 [Nephila pilipes]|uniref:Uncharacterized protein n=1 Tax=Nephila pilipes TaxID=299642 RepID=A0A8X6UIS2_NEPPI|nr:hypothetical protein NPIL_619461 [Nephila pilipes]